MDYLNLYCPVIMPDMFLNDSFAPLPTAFQKKSAEASLPAMAFWNTLFATALIPFAKPLFIASENSLLSRLRAYSVQSDMPIAAAICSIVSPRAACASTWAKSISMRGLVFNSAIRR